MSYIRKYLNEARNFSNESYLNADGFVDDEMSFAANEDTFYNNAAGDSAPMGVSSAPTSQPYIITVSNASATALTAFDVLGSYQYINACVNGNLTVSGVTITSAIANVNYQQFLYQTMNNPYSVGLTYIENVSGSASQVTSPLTLNTQDANGNQALKTLIPTIDPYQFQSGIIALKQLYRIDGFTKITISTIAANSVFRIHFYPADNINFARGLSGRPVSRQYAKPSVIKDQTVVVKG